MKKMRKFLVMVFAMILCLNIGFITAKADSANVTIALSSDTVSIGNNVTVTVTVSGSDVSQYDIYLTYDSSVLQFNSGSGAAQANGSGGTIRLVGGTGSTSISFTAIANGSCYVSTSGSEVYNINYEQVPISHAGASVTVSTSSGESTTEDNKTEDQDGNKTTSSTTEENTTEEDRSANCNLSSLQVSPGTLDPKFASGTTSYFVQLEDDITSIVVSAQAEDDKASVSVSGGDELKKGENIVKITVTAENGAVKIYNIRVAVGEILDQAEVVVDGKTYRIVDDATDLEVPERYSATTIQYQKWDIMAYQSPNGKIVLVCLEDEKYERAWFVYDKEQDSFIPYQEFSSEFNRYIILPVPENTAIPDGYMATELKIKNHNITAYQSANIDDKDIYLVYAMNIDGDAGFYLYDAQEGSFMRYVPEHIQNDVATTATVDDATVTDADTDAPEEGFFSRKNLIYILCGMGCILVALIIAIIVLGLKKKKTAMELEQAESIIEQLSEQREKIKGKEAVMEMTVTSEDTDQTEVPLVDIAEPETTEGRSDILNCVKSRAEDILGKHEESAMEEIHEVKAYSKDNKDENTKSEAESKKESDKKAAYESFEQESKRIRDKIKESYDASQDSAFAEEPAEPSKQTDSEKKDEKNNQIW